MATPTSAPGINSSTCRRSQRRQWKPTANRSPTIRKGSISGTNSGTGIVNASSGVASAAKEEPKPPLPMPMMSAVSAKIR